MNQKIETIVFDFGGVLIDWNPRYLFRKIFSDPKEMEHFLANVCTPDWNEQQDAGRTVKEAAEELLPKFPNYSAEINAFYGRWPEMLGGPIHGTVDILRTLKEKGEHRLYGLTNWSAETFPVAKARYDFLHWFEGILVSGEEKMRKPHAPFYELLLERYNINPETAIFIDDSARNVKASNEVGLPAIRFEGADKLRKDLKSNGVLV